VERPLHEGDDLPVVEVGEDQSRPNPASARLRVTSVSNSSRC
jgi:hypothetical protein